MLGTWRPHTEYQTHLLQKLKQLQCTHSKSIQDFTTTILKMWQMDLDPMQSIIAPLFSLIGRPSNQQPEIMRLLILMGDRREHDIDRWLKTVAATPLFCALAGLEADELPGASTLRDFISRLWQGEKPNPMRPPTCRPKGGFGKQKQPPKRPGIIAELCRKAKKGEIFGGVPESFLQEIFSTIALKSSALLGLLGNTQKLKVSADGTCVESHANPNGHKVCGCKGRCVCHRRLSDPQATWGWDSYHERFFYGHSLYALSCHNADLGLDLPLYLRCVDANQFDGVSLIEAFAHARSLYQGFLNFDALIADSAHDNYATYDLLRHFKVRPFIDLKPQKNGKIPNRKIFSFQTTASLSAPTVMRWSTGASTETNSVLNFARPASLARFPIAPTPSSAALPPMAKSLTSVTPITFAFSLLYLVALLSGLPFIMSVLPLSALITGSLLITTSNSLNVAVKKL